MSKLKDMRIKRGVKQCAVAENLGVTRQTYREYEKNPQRLNMAQAQTICRFLHCRLSDIFL